MQSRFGSGNLRGQQGDQITRYAVVAVLVGVLVTHMSKMKSGSLDTNDKVSQQQLYGCVTVQRRARGCVYYNSKKTSFVLSHSVPGSLLFLYKPDRLQSVSHSRQQESDLCTMYIPRLHEIFFPYSTMTKHERQHSPMSLRKRRKPSVDLRELFPVQRPRYLETQFRATEISICGVLIVIARFNIDDHEYRTQSKE